MAYNVYLNSYLYCAIAVPAFFAASLCGALLIMGMTFARFYSIIQPFKAASFNTTHRAKIAISFIYMISWIYNIPHIFTSTAQKSCLPYSNFKHVSYEFVQIYYWISFILTVCFPFVGMLGMNVIIIHTIRKRYQQNSQNLNEGQLKHSDKQVFIILLLVTFSYLALTTPGFLMFLLATYINFDATPKLFADFKSN